MVVKQEWYDILKKGVITPEILAACVYSSNKRAKNERDIEYELREAGDITGANQHKKIKKEFYREKATLLRLTRPRYIHMVRHLTAHDEYFHVSERFYLCYQIGDYICHQPIKEEYLERYAHLPKIDIGSMHGDGADESELLPQEFITHVISLVEKKKIRYKYN